MRGTRLRRLAQTCPGPVLGKHRKKISQARLANAVVTMARRSASARVAGAGNSPYLTPPLHSFSVVYLAYMCDRIRMRLIVHNIVHPLREAGIAFPRQLRNHFLWFAAATMLLVMVGLLNIYLQGNTPVEVTEMFEDPVAFAGLPLYIGVYTYLIGTMLILAGALLLFVAWSVSEIDPAIRVYIVALGALVLWLGLDDIFMIHEWVALRLAYLIESDDPGYDRQWLETPVFAAYALAWVGILVVFSRQILRTAWILLLAAFVAFGASVVIDLWEFIPLAPQPITRPQQVLVNVGEEMAKMAGALFILCYVLNLSRKVVQRGFESHDADENTVIRLSGENV